MFIAIPLSRHVKEQIDKTDAILNELKPFLVNPIVAGGAPRDWYFNVKGKDDRTKKWGISFSCGDFPKLEIVNPNKVLCDNIRCKTDLNGIPLYRDKDNNHFSYYGSVELGREYLKYFGNPLRPVS